MIDDLKSLEKLLKLCRKQGVLEINVHGVSFKLGDLPIEDQKRLSIESVDDPYKGFPTGELTPDQLIFYSSGGIPENDPTLKDEAV